MAENALNVSSPAQYSRFVQRLHRRYENWFDALPLGAPVRPLMEQALATLQSRGLDLPAALRVLRQLVMDRIIALDCEQGAPLSVVTRAVTELAELALDRACEQVRAELDARHGAPQGPACQPVQFWVIGMGKLGARELNVSSDIDLAGLPQRRLSLIVPENRIFFWSTIATSPRNVCIS